MTDDNKTNYEGHTPDEDRLMARHLEKFSDMPVTLGEILGKEQTALLDAITNREPIVSHGDIHGGNIVPRYSGLGMEVSGSMPHEGFELSDEQQRVLDEFTAMLPKRGESPDGITVLDANHVDNIDPALRDRLETGYPYAKGVDVIDPEIVDRFSGFDRPLHHGSDSHHYADSHPGSMLSFADTPGTGKTPATDYIADLMRDNSAALDAVIIKITDGQDGCVDIDVIRMLATPLYSQEDVVEVGERMKMYAERMEEMDTQYNERMTAYKLGLDSLDPEPQVTRDQVAYFESCGSTVPMAMDRAALDAGVPVARNAGLEAEIELAKFIADQRENNDTFRDLGYGFSMVL